MRALLIWLLLTSVAFAEPTHTVSTHSATVTNATTLGNSRCPPITSNYQIGTASWYGPGFYGRRTANGEIYTGKALTAASEGLPFGSLVCVTNLANSRSVVVRITDRGAFTRKYHRIIDLSPRAAQALGMLTTGTARVILTVLSWGGPV